MQKLFQPVLSNFPEPGHDLSNVLSVSEFIRLLRIEEDYFQGEQHNTRLMITRLRKIFHDHWGRSSDLIKATAGVKMRYLEQIMQDPVKHSKPVKRYADNEYEPHHRLITYRADDRVYGNSRLGQVPDIYQNDHQVSLLPDGTYCDIAHVLAGLDALNHKQLISPLPDFLFVLKKLLPHVDSNADMMTWMGDIASSSSDFLFSYLSGGKQQLTVEQEQHYIDVDAPGSRMLGDIDPYVIFKHYNVYADNGRRVSDILEEYYCDFSTEIPFRTHKYSIFCDAVGLRSWDGQRFGNEEVWLAYYGRQLRNNIVFQVFNLTEERFGCVWLPLSIYFGRFKNVIKYDQLLRLFLDSLKNLIKQEPLL